MNNGNSQKIKSGNNKEYCVNNYNCYDDNNNSYNNNSNNNNDNSNNNDNDNNKIKWIKIKIKMNDIKENKTKFKTINRSRK